MPQMPGSDLDLPPEIDTSRPHPARIYDYGLGGKNHFAADREVAERALAAHADGAHRGAGEPGVPRPGGQVPGGRAGNPPVP